MGGPIRSKRTGIVVVMSGFTVHVLESKMDYLNDQESKFLSSVKAREIRRTQRLPFVISGVFSGSSLRIMGLTITKRGYAMQDKCVPRTWQIRN